MDIVMHAIGYIHTPYKEVADLPRRGATDNETEGFLQIEP